ncbi:hypothetical protein RJ55_07076 [Drechmeria coniospora]|nr:hypothetical protein RJ55_07076 [Drechmeria coniospora]
MHRPLPPCYLRRLARYHPSSTRLVGKQAFTMRLLLSLFAATALALPASDTLQGLGMKDCPSFKTAADVARLREEFHKDQLERLRQCVPSHGLYEPYKDVSTMGYLAHSTHREPGCIPTVNEYACIYGFNCNFRQNCVKRLVCGPNDDIMDCEIKPCYEHTKEMQCALKKQAPPGMEHEIDYLDLNIQLGDTPAFGALRAEITVDGQVRHLPLFNTLAQNGDTHYTVNLTRLVGTKSINLDRLDDIRLVFDGQEQLTYAQLAVCNRGLQIRTFRIMIRHVASGLFFQAHPIAPDPSTGKSNFKHVTACRERDLDLFDTSFPFLNFESKMGAFKETERMKRCFDTWPATRECQKSQEYGETILLRNH